MIAGLDLPGRYSTGLRLIVSDDKILLVFFMVTSTYLDLDMIPAVRQQDDAVAASPANDVGGVVMVRLGSDGIPVIRGQAMSQPELGDHLRLALADEPLTQVVVLPSGAATTQALISVMDTATRAGAVRLRVIRLEARP
ncbi:MAG: biopolymer transporter ExbD [Rhodobacteraceae bacterium]|nr:biopolymer transporter ExbD [Paracoccaceae bacterium]